MAVLREHWGSRIGFILASIGSAVGLGNIWRFNYLAYKWGGGTFILVYLFALFTAALPILVLEFGIGHRFRRVSPLAFRKVSKPLEVIGWIPAVQMIFLVSYYCVILAYTLNYLYFSLRLSWGSDTNDFFFNQFLHVSESPWKLGTVVPGIFLTLLIVWFLNWVVIARGLQKGMELFSKILMPILVLLAVILVIRGVTLPGASVGIGAYLTPDWGKLGQPGLWLDAYSQIFFSLSVGFGIMITFASFLPRRANLAGDALTVALANSGFSVFVGFASFGTLGYLAHTSGKQLSEVVQSGIGLAFVVFPEALSKLPLPQVFAVLFFLTLFIAGFTSSLSLVEAVTDTFWDKYRWVKRKVVTGLCLFAFIVGLLFITKSGLYLLDITDHFISTYVLLFVGAAECVVIGWVYGIDRMIKHISAQPGMSLRSIFGTIMTYVVPLIMVGIAYAVGHISIQRAVSALTAIGETRPFTWFVNVASAGWPALVIFAAAMFVFVWSLRAREAEQFAVLIKYFIPAILIFVFYEGWFKEFQAAYSDYPVGALALFGGGFLLHIVVLGFLFAHSRGHPEVEAKLDAPESSLEVEAEPEALPPQPEV